MKTLCTLLLFCACLARAQYDHFSGNLWSDRCSIYSTVELRVGQHDPTMDGLATMGAYSDTLAGTCEFTHNRFTLYNHDGTARFRGRIRPVRGVVTVIGNGKDENCRYKLRAFYSYSD